jgi:hypothetical protein
VLEWRERSYAPGEESEVEIRFAPRKDGTLVELEHRGFAAFPDDHPARRGLGRVPAFEASVALWWGDLLTSARERARSRER